MKKSLYILIIGLALIFLLNKYIFNKEIKHIENTQIQYVNDNYNHEDQNHISDDDILLDEDHNHEGHDHEHLENEPIENNYDNKVSKSFKIKTLNGKDFSLNNLKGKKVFINFWTTWCPPCQEEMPQIQEYYNEYKDKHNVEVVAVNITDQDSGIDVIKEFRDYYQLTFPILLDEKGEVSKKYGVLTIPTSFVLNEEGNIVKEIIGPVTKDRLIEIFK